MRSSTTSTPARRPGGRAERSISPTSDRSPGGSSGAIRASSLAGRRYRARIAEWVLPVDLDQFLAAVEIRRRPELTGRPVIVGGDGNPRRPRQVVATASYEARAVGVRSGMPLATALRKCPDAVFLPHDRPTYDAASVEVMATLRTFPVVVEVWGWDEAFVGARTERIEPVHSEKPRL